MDSAAANREASIFGEKMFFAWEKRRWMSHDLNFWNLVITTRGNCLIRNRFGELQLAPGDILLSPPSHERFFAMDGCWGCFWFAFNLHIHINWNQPIREMYVVHPHSDTMTRILSDAEEACSLLAAQTGNIFPLVETLLESILLRGNADTFIKANTQLEAAKNFIASTLQIHNFDTVAKQFGMSRAKFFRDFRKAYGTTPQKYHEKIKFQNVCSMLATTDRSFSEIADFRACFIFQSVSGRSSTLPCANTGRKQAVSPDFPERSRPLSNAKHATCGCTPPAREHCGKDGG